METRPPPAEPPPLPSRLRAILLTALALLCLASSARADSETPTLRGPSPADAPPGSSVEAFRPKSIARRLRAFYELWLTGPSVRSLSGNKNGSGTNLRLLHTFAVGFALNDRWTLSYAQPFVETITDPDPATGGGDHWRADDPYLLLNSSNIYQHEKLGLKLFGYARFYLPFSKESRARSRGLAPNDLGNGALRVYLDAAKTFLDGRLTFNFITVAEYRLPHGSAADRAAANDGVSAREDFFVMLDPILAYSLSDSAELYLEYATGYLRHRTDGHLSKLNHPDDGQYLSLGLNIFAGPKLLLNPYLSAGPVFRGVKNTDVGLIASYTFL